MGAEPEYNSTNVPESKCRRKFHDLVSSNPFDYLIMTCIILNMFQMACFAEGASEDLVFFLDFSNYIFTIVFLIEGILKLIAFGKSYFNNAWN